jgi:hypothetical protein
MLINEEKQTASLLEQWSYGSILDYKQPGAKPVLYHDETCTGLHLEPINSDFDRDGQSHKRFQMHPSIERESVAHGLRMSAYRRNTKQTDTIGNQ